LREDHRRPLPAEELPGDRLEESHPIALDAGLQWRATLPPTHRNYDDRPVAEIEGAHQRFEVGREGIVVVAPQGFEDPPNPPRRGNLPV
jgi:hypothetical protein